MSSQLLSRARGALLTATGVAIAMLPVSAHARNTRVEVEPYLEVSQQVLANIKGDATGGKDVLTYSTVAAGVDVSATTDRVQGTINARYERLISWQKNQPDQDVISGLAQAKADLIRNTLSLEGGALATRIRSDGLTGANGSLNGSQDAVSQVYSFYAGPTLATHVGELSVNAAYRLGYNKLDTDSAVGFAGPANPDRFDDSTNHVATASVGMRPGVIAPVGWAVGAGYVREDASQLDQRYEQKWVRGDLTLPVSGSLALIGGVGYEDIQISQRDALRDGTGAPVIASDGRYITDASSPRLLSYDDDGLIWDAGVMWRPSRRTSAQFTVGHRYGSMSYTGSLAWNPSDATSLTIALFDGIDSFGRQINDDLSQLPTGFNAARNPFSGDLTGCAQGRNGGGICFNNALTALGSGSFRNRGVALQFASGAGAWRYGIGAGYAHRKFIAAAGSVLAGSNGGISQNYYANAFIGRKLDENSGIDANIYANFYESQLLGEPDVSNYGGYMTYYRNVTRRLSATAAVGVDGVDATSQDIIVTGLAQLGLRYAF